MGTTADQVARAALSAIETDAGLLRAVGWVSHRYRELTNYGRLRALRKIGELRIPATLETGTVTATRDSNIVTGNAAAYATWSPDVIGRYLKVSSAWYKVANFVPADELRLETKFSEDDASATAYKIVPRYLPVKPEARYLGKFVFTRLRRELQWQTTHEMDMNYPGRLLSNAAGPSMVSDFGRDDTGNRVVEIYPYPTDSEIVHYTYWEGSPDLHIGDLLPYSVDEYALKEGVLIDLYRYEMAKALRANQVDQSNTWANMSRSQETRWKDIIKQALKADKGADDVTLILRRAGLDSTRTGIIRDAHDEIYSRGDRP